MSTIALVPVQRLAGAKSRLAAHLAPEERHALVLSLLDRVLDALTGATLVDEVIVVSPDNDVLRHARVAGATTVLQPDTGLNAGIRLGRDDAIQRGADTLAIFLGDLPLLSSAEVDAFLDATPEHGVVLAPDRHERGTNAMVLRPPGVIEPAFGADSLRLHQAAIRERGLDVREFRAIGTGFDLDTIADLDELGRVPPASRPGWGVIHRHERGRTAGDGPSS